MPVYTLAPSGKAENCTSLLRPLPSIQRCQLALKPDLVIRNPHADVAESSVGRWTPVVDLDHCLNTTINCF